MPDSPSYQRLLQENTALKERIRHLALEHSILNELDFPTDIPTLAEYLQCTFYSEDLILVVIHAHADPLRRHTSPLAAVLAPETPVEEGHPMIYYPEPAMNAAEEILCANFAPQTHCIVFRALQDIGVLLNPKAAYISSNRIRSGDYYAQVLMQLEIVIRQLNAQLSFDNVATVSALRHGKASLREMYLETRNTYDYSWNLTGQVFSYPRLFEGATEAQEHMEISTLEIEFLNDINRLLFFEASVVLDNILDRQFSHAVPLSEVKISVTARLRNVVAVLDASGRFLPQDVHDAFGLVTLVAASASVPELLDRIHDFFALLSEQSPRNPINKTALILDFIQANYKNPALSAQLICDRFRISPAYLSRLIKAETGQGLLHCIHGFRVEQAKVLLTETSLGIEQVALQVGFSGRHGLIRAFRALEDTTPSEYRNRHQSRKP